ncbi:MAG: FtsW/RodA/SpoVE family cell cycle protein [Clostridiales bacterium]|nr:FtsW/RodA/SpoVE family cell cycle protein [Clostridiales bacterium]
MDLSSIFEKITGIFEGVSLGDAIVSITIRPIFVFLALYVLVRCIVSLVKSKNPPEVWAYLKVARYAEGENGEMIKVSESNEPLTHWENVIGRARSCDISVSDKNMSRNHGLLIRDEEGNWTFRDLGSVNGTWLSSGETPEESYKDYRTKVYSMRNAYLDYIAESEPKHASNEFIQISKGKGIEAPAIGLEYGDVLRAGLTEFTLLPTSLEEKNNNLNLRKTDTKVMTAGPAMAALTLFQILTFFQLWLAKGEDYSITLATAFGGLMLIEWLYYGALRVSHRAGFEMEVIAFFLSTLSLAVVASKSPDALMKQTLCIAIGVAVMFIMCIYLRDLERSKVIRWILVIGTVVLFALNLALAATTYGAKNWISIAGFTFQPSELVKVAFIWVGAGTLDELFRKKNLYLFMAFSLFCFACLGLMGDFGTAMIFFVTYLVISFLRSGDFTKLFLVLGAAAAGGFMILRFKPYIADRFATWMHVWDPDLVDAAGFQQSRTLCASASGGLLGVGAGEGWLNGVFAADMDLTFGMLIEEWGLIIACFAVFAILTLAFFAIRSITSGRSTFYTIAACGATSMLVFQTMLATFGCTDILPFTGVTFPFVSNGGTSMMVSWALLAFLKSADTRLHASLAVKGGGK